MRTRCEDLGVGGLEPVLGVQRAFPPGRFVRAILIFDHLGPALAGFGHGGGDRRSGLGVVVEEGAGDIRASGDGGNADLGLLAPEPGDGLVDPLECCLGFAAAGCQGRGRAGFWNGSGLHAMSCWESSSAVYVSLYLPSFCPPSPASARSVARKAVDQMRWK